MAFVVGFVAGAWFAAAESTGAGPRHIETREHPTRDGPEGGDLRPTAAVRRTRREIVPFVSLILLVVQCILMLPGPAAVTVRLAVPPLPSPSAVARALVQAVRDPFVNETRTRYRVLPLAWSPALATLATASARTLAEQHRIVHTANLAARYGLVVPAWTLGGENVGSGRDLDQLDRAFYDSPAHRANLVDSEYTHYAVGVAVGDDGQVYTVEMFARIGSWPPRHTTARRT